MKIITIISVFTLCSIVSAKANTVDIANYSFTLPKYIRATVTASDNLYKFDWINRNGAGLFLQTFPSIENMTEDRTLDEFTYELQSDVIEMITAVPEGVSPTRISSISTNTLSCGAFEGNKYVYKLDGFMGCYTVYILTDGKQYLIGRLSGIDCDRLARETEDILKSGTILTDQSNETKQIPYQREGLKAWIEDGNVYLSQQDTLSNDTLIIIPENDIASFIEFLQSNFGSPKRTE